MSYYRRTSNETGIAVLIVIGILFALFLWACYKTENDRIDAERADCERRRCPPPSVPTFREFHAYKTSTQTFCACEVKPE